MATPVELHGARVVLTEEDIPGAALDIHRLETYTVSALRWWLLCRGISPPTSMKKAQLISKISEALKQKLAVIDVDGSYLYRKEQQLISQGVSTLPLPLPTVPLTGWEVVTADNYHQRNIPKLMPGTLYTYLSVECERLTGHGAFRALQRGYVHWASGRISRIEVNCQHPMYCHVRCTMTPSMKPGVYHVYVLLGKDDVTTIKKATCECAAGMSASCTHVSGLLHALVSITQVPFGCTSTLPDEDEEDQPLPVTSYACQWKIPQKRKESNMKMSDLRIEKHVYGRVRKNATNPIVDFDPRPSQFHGTLCARLPEFLEKVKGKGLGISLLVDPSTQVWCENSAHDLTLGLPSRQQLIKSVNAFIQSLEVSDERIREIERSTREQHRSPLWFDARRYRLTASLFGDVLRRLPVTPPDALVLRIIDPRQFVSQATEYGKNSESTALEQYKATRIHTNITICSAGFVIYKEKPYLGATPDAYIHDPNREEEYGLIEIKCPYKYRNMSPEDACSNSDFCSVLSEKLVCLKCNHRYYSQIQGQLAITGRSWCDFLIYTKCGIAVETIHFNEKFWKEKLLPALVKFYENCVAPEIVSPLHTVGMHLRDLSKN